MTDIEKKVDTAKNIEKNVYGNAVQLFRRDAGDDLAHIFTFQC